MSDRWIWLRLPLVPIVLTVGCVVVAALALIHLLSVPWVVLYPEWQPHEYDYGDERDQEVIRRWRSYCRRVPLQQRLRNFFGELWRG